jgi:hypothetical protein
MKFENLNFGKPLSRAEQKLVKGGYQLCQVGQIVTCGGGCCGTVTTKESSYTACMNACGQPPVPGYPNCYAVCYW